MPFSGMNSGVSDGKPYVGSNPGPTDGHAVTDSELAAAKAKLVSAYKTELATFTRGTLVMPKLLPGEVGGDAAHVRICCDKDPFKVPPTNFTCDCNGTIYEGENCADEIRRHRHARTPRSA